MFRISYIREEGIDLYRVTFHQLGQTIILSGYVLEKKIGMKSNVLVGCKDVSAYAIIDLGFVFPTIDNLKVI